MFTIAQVIRLLTRIFVKQNRRFPKGLEGVDIRLKAKKIYDVGKSQGYEGGISENQLKQFLAWEKQALVTKEVSKDIIKVPKKKGEVFDLTGKKIKPDETIIGGKGYKIETEAENIKKLDELLGPDDDVFGSPMKDWYKKKFKEPKAKDVTPTDIVADTIATIKSKKPIDAMKEANSVIGRKGIYKNLTEEQSQKILKETNDHIFQRDIPIDPEDLAHGGRTGTGLNYLLGEDDQNTRVPYEKGGWTQEDFDRYLQDRQQRDKEKQKKDFLDDFEKWKKWKDTQGGTIDWAADGGRIGLKKGTRKESWTDKLTRWAGGPSMVAGDLGFEGLHQIYNLLGMGGLYAEGGRTGFGLGGMGRRAFLKLMGGAAATGAAAKTGLFGLLKAGKPTAGVLTSVPIKAGVDGMPVWFKPLVNRIIKEGNHIES